MRLCSISGLSRRGVAAESAARLREQGLNALSFPDLRGSAKHYVVRVGRYESYAEAQQTLATVRRVQADAFIVP